MPKYIAEFSYTLQDTAFVEDEKKNGYGEIDIETDHEPTTEEDFKEIAKELFRQIPFCASLAVHRLRDESALFEQLNGHLENEDNTSEVIPGEVYVDGEALDK